MQHLCRKFIKVRHQEILHGIIEELFFEVKQVIHIKNNMCIPTFNFRLNFLM